MICKILGLFVNTMTAADKNAVLNLDNFNAIKSDKRNKKTFPDFSFGFLEFRSNLEDFENEKTLIADVRKKNLVSENPSISDMENGPKCC